VLELTKGYNLVVEGMMGGNLKIVLYEVQGISATEEEGKLSIKLSRPPRELYGGESGLPPGLSRIFGLADRNEPEREYFFLDLYTDNLEDVSRSLNDVLTRHVAAIPGFSDVDVDVEERIRHVVSHFLTEVAAAEASLAVKDQAAAAANN
jgi:hypothetical protein